MAMIRDLGRLALAAVATAAGLTTVVAGEAVGAAAVTFRQPIACMLGQDCFIQSYVDIDPGSEVRDFACGSATYEGHDGTDFRITSAVAAESGVAVLAAAAGTVKATRDGMEDRFATQATRALVANRECGNGVVIDHGGGWETQYCHMKAGSIAVAKGDVLEAGARLGDVGYSGLAEFAHLHFTVRKDGKVLDPFLGGPQAALCVKALEPDKSLWEPAFDSAFAYRNGEILAAEFVAAVPKLDVIETDGGKAEVSPTSAQLVFMTRLMNLKAGDVVRVTAEGPGGFAVESTSKPVERSKATYLAYAGKRLKAPRWADGKYTGKVELVRDGTVVAERRGELTLP